MSIVTRILSIINIFSGKTAKEKANSPMRLVSFGYQPDLTYKYVAGTNEWVKEI